MNEINDITNKQYRHTGITIPVPKEEFIYYIFSLLQQYDSQPNTPENVQYSPYKDPIIYTLADKRQVEIPKEIQQEAVKRWIDQKSQAVNEDILKKPAPKIKENLQDTPSSGMSNLFKFLIIVAFGLAIYYYYFKK